MAQESNYYINPLNIHLGDSDEVVDESVVNLDFYKSTEMNVDRNLQFARYQIDKKIGQGGMGTVYRVYDSSLKRYVALKTISHDQNSHTLNRFFKEAKAMATLSHPGIVSLYDIGIENDVHFFTMELVEGDDLGKYIRKQKMNPRTIAKLMKSICNAIDYAHQKGIVHRDIKPSNILLDADKNPKVMDFGLARETRSESKLSKSGVSIGTPSYMSPEQAQGNRSEIDHRSDVYSLGAVLYEMMVGHAPFQGSSTYAIIMDVVEKDPIPPRKISSRVPVDLEKICLKALHKDRNLRYKSAARMAMDLECFLQGEPIRAYKAGLFYILKKWFQRNKALGTSLVMFLLILSFSIYRLFATAQELQVTAKKLQNSVKTEREKSATLERLRKAGEEKAAKLEKSQKEAKAAKIEAVKKSLLLQIDQADKLWSAGNKQWAARSYLDILKGIPKSEKSFEPMRVAIHSKLALLYYQLPSNEFFLIDHGEHGKKGKAALSVVDIKNRTIISTTKDQIKETTRSIELERVVLKNTSGYQDIFSTPKHGEKTIVHDLAIAPKLSLFGFSVRNKIQLWNYKNVQRKHIFEHSTEKGTFCSALSFHPHKPFLVSGGNTNKIRIWDVRSGKLVKSFAIPLKKRSGSLSFMEKRLFASHGVEDMAFSADGETVACGFQNFVYIWDFYTGKIKQTIELADRTKSVNVLQFEKNGNLLGVAQKDQIIIWNLNLRMIQSILTGHSRSINSLDFHPDGEILVSGSRDSSIRTWNLVTNSCENILQQHENSVNLVRFLDQSKQMISCDTGKIGCLSQIPSPSAVLKRSGVSYSKKVNVETHLESILDVKFSPDRKLLLSGSRDRFLKVWDWQTRKWKKRLLTLASIRSITFQPQGKNVVLGHSKNMYTIWDTTTWKMIKKVRYSHGMESVLYVSDHEIFSAGQNGKLTRWNLANLQQPKATFSVADIGLFGFFSLAVNPSKTILAIGDGGGNVYLLDLKTNKIFRRMNFASTALSLVFHPEKPMVVSGHGNGDINIWNFQNPDRDVKTYLFRRTAVNKLAFLDNQTLVSCGEEGKVCLWNIQVDYRTPHLVLGGHLLPIQAMSMIPEENVIVTGGDDLAIGFWKIQSHPEIESIDTSISEIENKFKAKIPKLFEMSTP